MLSISFQSFKYSKSSYNFGIKFRNYNCSCPKDSVYFSGKPEPAELLQKENDSVVVPVEEMRKLFEEADRKNRETQEFEEKQKIIVRTFKEQKRILDEFVERDIDKLPEEEQRFLSHVIHRTKTAFQNLFFVIPSSPDYSDYDNICKEKFADILLDLETLQWGINNPKPSQKAQQD